MLKTELAIVGAGPAGMAAAETGIECGLDVALVDEQPLPGGQIYRQPPTGFTAPDWLSGRSYRQGKALLNRISDNLAVRWLLASTAVGITRGPVGGDSRFTLVLEGKGGIRRLTADAVLIAPGCYDMPVIFPGWNLPGVMAAGGIQAFVKSQQLIPGNRILFVGSHPLQLIVADQVVKSGGEVAGVYFAQSRRRLCEWLRSPAVVFHNRGKLALAAASLRRLWLAGVPVKFGHTLMRANGRESLHSVTTAPISSNGTINKNASANVECDRLGVCFSFLASSELARQAGADCAWNTARGGWIARHDEWMCSNIPGIYLAGEITGVAGAEVAAEEGRLAALGCASELGKIPPGQAADISRPIRRRLRRLNRFARLLSEWSWPGSALLDQLTSESANLCKCEEVTVGAFLKMLQQNPHVSTASSAKLLSRVGMGLCQGRYCHFAATRAMARHLNLPETDIGGFTSRFPAKPIEIDKLINSDICEP